jgi:intracellular sulfur oxidation DsrE/DsrF family protein
MNSSTSAQRRSFITRWSAAATALGAALGAGRLIARPQAPATGSWSPARHEQDDWLDTLPVKHRFVFDTTTAAGFGGAVLFANNYFIANMNGYGLQNSDLAVVIVARHHSTAFAYNDAVWSKYGAIIAAQINFMDPKTNQPPKGNLYNVTGYGTTLENYGVTVETLLKRGVHLAVCQMATRALAGAISRSAGGTADSVYNELVSNLLINAHMVPAGIVAVNRAQERGYSFVRA